MSSFTKNNRSKTKSSSSSSSSSTSTKWDAIQPFIDLLQYNCHNNKPNQSPYTHVLDKMLTNVNEFQQTNNDDNSTCFDTLIETIYIDMEKLRKNYGGDGKQYYVHVKRILNWWDQFLSEQEQHQAIIKPQQKNNNNSKPTINQKANPIFSCPPVILDTKVSFADLKGAEFEKQQIYNSFIYPSQYPYLFPKRESGLLLYGVPGGGKSLLAKAIATELGRKDDAGGKAVFFAPTPESLKGKYQGESEAKIANIFKCAQDAVDQGDATFAIIFFDEIDSIAGKKSAEDTSSALTVNTLLQYMDGFGKDDRISVIAATNYPEHLESAILRRFPSKIFVDLPTRAAREAIILSVLQTRFASKTPMALIQNLGSRKYHITQEHINELVERFGPHSRYATTLMKHRSSSSSNSQHEFSDYGTGVGYSASEITTIVNQAINFACEPAIITSDSKDQIYREWPNQGQMFYVYVPTEDENVDIAKYKVVRAQSIKNDASRLAQIRCFDLRLEHFQRALAQLPNSVTEPVYANVLHFLHPDV